VKRGNDKNALPHFWITPVLYDALALLGGLLLPLAFAPFNLAFLAVVALLLLFAGWLSATPGRAFRRGYLFGLGQFGFGVSWVYVSMHDYGGAGVLEAGGLTALFTLFLALYPAGAGWLAARLFPGGPVLRAVAVLPAVWTLLDWFRGWFLTGFTWLNVGYSQTDTPLSAVAPVFGSFGVGWAVALLAGLGLASLRLAGPPRRLAALSLAAVLGLCAGLDRITWTQAAGEPFKVALLQGNIPQDMKWQPENQRATLRLYWDLNRAHWDDARLIVWPETAIPAFYHQVKDTFLADLQAEATQRGVDVLVGVPYYDLKQDTYYNALVGIGARPGLYFKRHLVPFGEFLPLRPLLGWVLDILEIPLADFRSGNGDQPPLVAAGHPLAASICYEDIFGQESLAGLPAARYLVNVTNDAWFGDSIAPHQHVQMARMRALEAGRYMLRATNTGVTAIITPKGKLAATAPLFQQAHIKGEITPMQGATPYVRWGDGPVVGGLALLLGGLALRRRRTVREAGAAPVEP
jgi:apolipoprotein N-acyltransferase